MTIIKERINLEKVALIGRRYSEYERMFRLNDFNSVNYKILDIGSGVSSFCAESSELDLNVLAIDPIYDYEPNELEIKCEKDLNYIIDELNGVEHLYKWDMFRNKKELIDQRSEAYRAFIKHYKTNRGRQYVPEKMPKTNLKSKQFDVALMSHLLFLYDHILDYDFHKETINEMLRLVSKEIRIFPLVNLYGKKSEFIQEVFEDNLFKDYKISIERVNYEFIKGGNEILRISI